MARSCPVIDAAQLNQLDAQQLREIVRSMMSDMAAKEAVIAQHDAAIDAYENENFADEVNAPTPSAPRKPRR